jgi:hypothetical protein
MPRKQIARKEKDLRPTPLRLRIGAVLLVLLALRMIQTRIPPLSALKPPPAGSDAISRAEQRFTGIRQALPEYGRVGYATDLPPDQVLTDGDASGQYYLAEYSLAPLQVVNSRDEKIVVGDFREPKGLQAVLDQTDLRIVRDFGRGLFLLEREGP